MKFIKRHWPILTVAVVALACFLSPIRQGDLEADASLYAWMGRRMLATGEYLRPAYDWAGREPYFFKPPGQFWLSTVAYRLLGYTIPAARLTPALLWAAAALVLYLIVRLQHPRGVAATAAVALCVQRELVMNAMEVRLDGGMVLSQLIAGYGAVRLMRGQDGGPAQRRWFALVGGGSLWHGRPARVFISQRQCFALVGGGVGLGLMLRGGPTLLCLPAILAALAWGRRWAALRDVGGWAVAVLVGLLVAGPWYLHEWLTWGGRFAAELGGNAIGRNLQTDAGMGVAALLFYYARRIAESYFLWLLPAIAGAAVLAVRGRRGRRLGPVDRLAVASLAVYFVLIHLSTQRNIRYAIPLFPWLGVLAAVGLYGLPPVRNLWRRVLPAAGFVAVGLGAAVWFFGLPKVPDRGTAVVRAAPVVRAALGLSDSGSLRSGKPPDAAVVWLVAAAGIPDVELNDQKRCAIQFYTGGRCEVAALDDLPAAPPGRFVFVFTDGTTPAAEAAVSRLVPSATVIDRNKRWLIVRR